MKARADDLKKLMDFVGGMECYDGTPIESRAWHKRLYAALYHVTRTVEE